jgi:hypothetical protein
MQRIYRLFATVNVVKILPGFRKAGDHISPTRCDDLRKVRGQLTGQRAVWGDLEIHRTVWIEFGQNREGAAVEGAEIVDQTFRFFEIRTIADS